MVIGLESQQLRRWVMPVKGAGVMTGFWTWISRAFLTTWIMFSLMRAVCKHTDCRWIILYIARRLKAPTQSRETGFLVDRDKGTPQGGVISPLLANLFLHYAFDGVDEPEVSADSL